jgi:hypothetical protein
MSLKTVICATTCLLLTNTALSQPVTVTTNVLVNSPASETPDLWLQYEAERTPLFPPDYESRQRERTDRMIAVLDEIRLLIRELAEEQKLKKQ